VLIVVDNADRAQNPSLSRKIPRHHQDRGIALRAVADQSGLGQKQSQRSGARIFRKADVQRQR